MLKKLLLSGIVLLSIGSCKEESSKDGKSPNAGTNAKEGIKKDSIEKAIVQPAISDSAGVYTLKFKLEVGKTYPLKTNQNDVITVTDPTGKSEKATQNMIDEMSFTINEFKGGIYDVSVNLVSKKTENEMQGKKISVDTKQAAPKEKGLKTTWNVNKALVGKKLNMKMDESGKISSITGFDPIYQGVSKAIEGVFKDQKEKKQFVEGFKQGFNDKTLKEQFTKNLVLIPAKGVKIGESWSNSENVTPDGKIKLTTKYTLIKVENGKAQIKVSGGIPLKSEKQKQEQYTHSISLEGVQTGTINYDTQSGWLASSQINMTTTQKEGISDGKQSQTMTKKTNSIIKVNP